MPINRDLRLILQWARRAALLTLFASGTAMTASGQVVDLPTTPLNQDPSAATQPALEPPIFQPEGQSPSDVPLNTDPNASIDDLVQPPAAAPQQQPQQQPQAPAQNFGGRQTGLGAGAASFSAAPMMMGDFFGGGLAAFSGTQVVPFSGHAPGTIISGFPGDANSIIAFDFPGPGPPGDVFTTGMGQDLAGNPDGADTFMIAEPLPPNDALTSPGPGFVFDGGTAVYTVDNTNTTAQPGIYNNGETWFISYSYSQTLGVNPDGAPLRPIPGPGVATRRVKIAENFSPEVRDRAFANYSFFNDAFGGLGDISRYVIGFEKVIFEDLVSFEARLPMAGTYGSRQSLDRAPSRDFELGNITLIAKGVLLRTDRIIWSGGLGVGLPLADDTVIRNGNQTVIEIENETVHLLPFMGLLVRRNRDTNFQSYLQLDIAANGDPIFADLRGGALPQIGVFNDSTVLHADVAMSHSFYRNRRGRFIKQAIANTELHYTGTLQESDFVSSNGLTYQNLKRNFNIVNATVGMHLVVSDKLVVTPGISVPLRDGLDEQFDYEAQVQVNLLR